jgi:hypothetical protein
MKKIILTTIASLLVATTFSQRTVYVDIDATGSNNGTNWANAYNNPDDAFSNASKGDNIWIAEGTYSKPTTNRSFSFEWEEDSVSVYGGFDGTETALSQRDWRNNSTIFSGEIQGDNDLTNNSHTVLNGPIGSVFGSINYSLIDGITIRDGYSITSGSNNFKRWGAGFYLQDRVRRFHITNCVFTNNTAQGAAAIYASTSGDSTYLEISNTKFIGNKSSFASCIWSQANSGYQMNMRMNNCLFTDNINKNYGGVQEGSVFYFGSNGTSANTLISMANNTITNNVDSVSSGPTGTIIRLYKTHNSQSNAVVEMGNCILYNNPLFSHTTKNYSLSSYNFTSVALVNCISDIHNYINTFRTNVYTHNPLFTNASTGDYTLQSTSPAIDSGIVTPGLLPAFDLAGLTRIKGASVDLGCYEYQTIAVGINENKEFASLNVFPNPTTGHVTFESNEEIELIDIYTLTGQKVNSFINTNSINISEFTPGIYMAKIISGNKIATKRIIKQ